MTKILLKITDKKSDIGHICCIDKCYGIGYNIIVRVIEKEEDNDYVRYEKASGKRGL